MGDGLTSLEFVTVGNAGNTVDSTGYGAVAYVYAIGKYEVTAGQYTEFLNAVAAVDKYGLYTVDMLGNYGCKIVRSGSSGNYTYSVVADRANRPVTHVSWGDAVRFTNWLHNGQVVNEQGLDTTEDGAYYTNYDKGINGLMIDMDNLPGPLTLNDFLFRRGNDAKPYGDDLSDPDDDWAWAPDPIAIAIRRGAGQNGTDRVTLIWEDGAIRNCWLQVTMLATDAIGLLENQVFYVGNAVGESGNATTNALVNATDEIGARNNPHTPVNLAAIVDYYDFNRDKLVNATDQIIARNNRTSPLTALKLITPPVEPASGGD